jgi:dihydroxyacetone kinase phosphotransfer subunit
MAKLGILITSHVPAIAEGITALLGEIANDVPITFAGGTDDGGIGSSFEKISQAAANNDADEILAFYDLGSAKMTLEMVIEMSDKKIHLLDAALIEGAYTAAALAQGGSSLEAIMEQLERLMVKRR